MPRRQARESPAIKATGYPGAVIRGRPGYEAGLKEQLKAKVERAARGVKAKVEVEVDEKKGWKERFKNAVGKLRLEVEDVTDDVERERAAAEVQARRKSIMFRAELTRRRLLAAVKAAWAEAQTASLGDGGEIRRGVPGHPRSRGTRRASSPDDARRSGFSAGSVQRAAQ